MRRRRFGEATSALSVLLSWGALAGADSFPAFESGHVRPLALSPSGGLLFAVNTPDNRLEVFRTEGGSLAREGETVVGLEPVAVAARSESQVFVVNHLSDSVSVIDVTEPGRPYVRETLLVGDEPRDVVVAGPRRNRVFVSAARRGQSRPGDAGLASPGLGRADVWVFDADDTSAAPRIVTLFCDTPRALGATADGRLVYAAAFLSGNRTTVINQASADPFWGLILGDGFATPGPPPPHETTSGDPAPSAGLIVRFDDAAWRDAAGRDWAPRMRSSLPDLDLFAIDALADAPVATSRASGVGTVLFNLAVSPANGHVYVSNLEALNHERFEPALRGRVTENRVTIIDGESVRPVHLNPHIDHGEPSGTPEEIAASLALPLGMEFSADGERLYLCAFGSGKVAVLDTEGSVLERIEIGGGPSGLALHEAARRLYVMDRFGHAVSVVDLDSRREAHRVRLRHDPEPAAVREGRRYFYDARGSSGHGDAACASCHLFADLDGLAWDLGDPSGVADENPLVLAPLPGQPPLLPFHPMKGPMATQSLRGLRGAGAMHWRGDRNGGAGNPFDADAAFMAFRPAFQGLLGRKDEFSVGDMERLRDFVLSIRYPPNPIARIDGTLSPVEEAGRRQFESDGRRDGAGGDGSPCTACHVPPLGTSGLAAGGRDQSFKVPHLRNLYQKVGMFGSPLPRIRSAPPVALEPAPTPHLGDQVRGFGFTHDGSFPTLLDFFLNPLETFTFPDEEDHEGVEKAAELEAFLMTFPTGLAPSVGQQVTLSADGLERRMSRLRTLLERADAGDGNLVLHGILGGVPRGLLYGGRLAGATPFRSDREVERFSLEALESAVASGAAWTATLVPPGSGYRIGIDRDADGALDRDEVDKGFDPADPGSRPPGGALSLPGDCSGDGALNITDPLFGLDFLFLGGRQPPCETSCDSNQDGLVNVSDAVYTLEFLFSGGPPPGLYPACQPAARECDGGLCP